MSILSPYTGYSDFKTIDDATGMQVENVLWVDDEHLEYAFVDTSGPYLESKILKVTRVSVNHCAREIHLNEPRLISIRLVQLRSPDALKPPQPCDECCDEGACSRIGQCMRFKCAFGEVSKP